MNHAFIVRLVLGCFAYDGVDAIQLPHLAARGTNLCSLQIMRIDFNLKPRNFFLFTLIALSCDFSRADVDEMEKAIPEPAEASESETAYRLLLESGIERKQIVSTVLTTYRTNMPERLILCKTGVALELEPCGYGYIRSEWSFTSGAVRMRGHQKCTLKPVGEQMVTGAECVGFSGAEFEACRPAETTFYSELTRDRMARSLAGYPDERYMLHADLPEQMTRLGSEPRQCALDFSPNEANDLVVYPFQAENSRASFFWSP